MRGGRLSNGDSERGGRFGSGLDPKRGIRAGVDPNDRRAPSGFFFRNIVEDHLIPVCASVQWILYLIYPKNTRIGIITGRRYYRDMFVTVRKPQILRCRPRTDRMKTSHTRRPRLDIRVQLSQLRSRKSAVDSSRIEALGVSRLGLPFGDEAV